MLYQVTRRLKNQNKELNVQSIVIYYSNESYYNSIQRIKESKEDIYDIYKERKGKLLHSIITISATKKTENNLLFVILDYDL